MDSKHKESFSTLSPARKSSNSGGDVSESARELAQNALTEFNKNNFTSASQSLSKLQASRPKDVKVLSNKAVVDYYISGLKKTEHFQKTLFDICNQASIKMTEIKSGDEVEASAIRLNRCSVLFHLHQLNNARSLLESMYKGLESLEESVSIGLCLLLAEVLLGLSLPGRAFSVVGQTEATFLPPPLQPQSAAAKLHADKDNPSLNKGSSKNASLDSTTATSAFKRPNIMPHDPSENDSIGGSSEMRCSADQELLRCKLQLLRLRSLLQMKAVKAARKELKSLLSHSASAANAQGITLSMLKSQLEYLSGSHKKALKIMEQCVSTPLSSVRLGPPNRVAYYNNLGVIHIGLKKPMLACLYFRRAIGEFKSAYLADTPKTDDSPLTRNLYSNCGDTWMQLCYNLGVSLMTIGHFNEAFNFLVEVAKSHASNARLWLRLAECCIAVHRENVYKEKGSCFRYKIVGEGEHRKICLDTHIGGHNKKLADQQTTPDPALPVPSLEFGRLCLMNCLALIPKDVSTTFITEEQEAAGLLPDLYASPPSNPMRCPQLIDIKMRCLAGLAYTSLCLGFYMQAHERSTALLALIGSVPKFDPVLKLLGHFYAGEALSLLGRSAEALPHFDPKHVTETPIMEDVVPLGCGRSEDEVWVPVNGAVTTKMIYYNMSVAFAMRKQFEKAYILLREVFNDGNTKLPAQVIMLALYLNLQLGYMESVGPITEKGLSAPYL